jgi:AMMECR1 domain-containing protein
MGSFEAPAGGLYAAALRTAWRATREDVRSRPLRAEDLAPMEIVVTFVGRPVPIPSAEYVSPWKEGLLAVQGDRSAVVVPGEAKTTRYAVRLALRNSGIDPEGGIQYSRFEAVTWREREGGGLTQRRQDAKGGG